MNHLTKAHSEKIQQYARDSVPGMAHWAGTGPAKKTCLQCQYFKTNGYYSVKGKNKGSLKPGNCKKFTAMTRGQKTPIGHENKACMFFAESVNVPVVRKK